MQNSQVWNSAHIWKTRLTQGNNVTVFVTHILWGLTMENNLRFIWALFTWDCRGAAAQQRPAGDPRQGTVAAESTLGARCGTASASLLLARAPCSL